MTDPIPREKVVEAMRRMEEFKSLLVKSQADAVAAAIRILRDATGADFEETKGT